MKHKSHLILLSAIFTFTASIQGVVHAAIIEAGDLNIIDDPGNPSDGLRYLDLSFSDEMTLVDALSNAQASYSNARVATPAEFNDLAAAAGVIYDGSLKFSDGFTTGGTTTIASSDPGVILLTDRLGLTETNAAQIFTDPDSDLGIGTTRDELQLNISGYAFILQSSASAILGHTSYGWLLVSEATSSVPEPNSLFLFAIASAVGAIFYRRRPC